MLVICLLRYGKINGIELHKLCILCHSLVRSKHNIARSFSRFLCLVNRIRGKIMNARIGNKSAENVEVQIFGKSCNR